MVRDHIKQLQSHQYSEIARQMDLTSDDVAHHVEIVKHLDPRPGLKYSKDRSTYVVPDVFVVKEGEDYKIVLNDDGLPKLRISPTYRRMLETKDADSDGTRDYVKDKLRSALWLLKSVDQRQRTIYKVAESIVRQQRDFLDRGIDHLKPMVLRDVAEDIGMHESTVSRVVSNKYIHTPRGLYPMKFFFHSGIDREYGDNISSLTVKRKIQQLIQGEDAHRPLSDSELMRVLNREGINIARRTVAKYRDELAIPSSTDRKQIF
jgi:RNA polymerase sigma-54 factor